MSEIGYSCIVAGMYINKEKQGKNLKMFKVLIDVAEGISIPNESTLLSIIKGKYLDKTLSTIYSDYVTFYTYSIVESFPFVFTPIVEPEVLTPWWKFWVKNK